MKKFLQRLASFSLDTGAAKRMAVLLTIGFADEARMERDMFLR